MPEIAQDAYSLKIQQELDVFKNNEVVHDLPKIFHYWSNKYLNPLLIEAGYKNVTDIFVSAFINVMNTVRQEEPFLFASIGAGNCDLEIEVALRLVDMGHEAFHIECIEIDKDMLDRGRKQAADRGVADKILFSQTDFNTWRPRRLYDGFMANHSLHHVVELEHLFSQIKSHSKAHGVFAINDIIGRNGHQRWPESLDIVDRFWKNLPKEKRYNLLLQRYEDTYENWDCSTEGFE